MLTVRSPAGCGEGWVPEFGLCLEEVETGRVVLDVDDVAMTYLPPPRLLRPLVRTAAARPVSALCGVSVTIVPGEIVGLVGPNGAGKTTLLRIIAGLLHPTRGRVSVGGHDVTAGDPDARRTLGLVLDGDRGLYSRLSGRQNLEFFATMSGLAPAAARRRAGELLELVDLTGADKLVFGYSAGMRSRLCMARALITDPPLLVLDEPTRSLDPLGGACLLEGLRSQAGRGAAVLLSSHRLDEVTSICSRVVALVDGTIRHDAPAGALDDAGGPAAALTALLHREAARR